MHSHVPQNLEIDRKWLYQICHILDLSFFLNTFERKTHLSESITEFLPFLKAFFKRMQAYFLVLIGLAGCSSPSRGEFGFNRPADRTFRWDIVSLRQEMLPCSLDEDDRVIKGPNIVNVLKLHVKYSEIVSLWVLSRFPVFKEISVYESHRTIEQQMVTAFLDVNNAIVDKFKRRDIVDNSVFYLRVSLHWIVMVCKVQQNWTPKDALDSIHSSQFIMMQLQYL